MTDFYAFGYCNKSTKITFIKLRLSCTPNSNIRIYFLGHCESFGTNYGVPNSCLDHGNLILEGIWLSNEP